ncbi:MAG TPA: zinc-dependent alcohol dehydrogenase family protein, partial [Armatimonadota bacterium]|nr:zinc-dependent alcohol dehydrogenase family protein [Armatimonadota bacterium]
VREVATPTPRGTEALVRVRACGVCKTDVHIHHGRFFAAFPLIPGHEFAGEVAAVGEAVTRVQVGDRVAADNQYPCGRCDACRGGTPLFCAHMTAQGVNAPGGFAEYTLVDEARLYPLADTVSFDEGALIEPAACAVHGIDVIAPRAGDDALQFGAGGTGLILAQLLRGAGVATLAVADLSPRKLALAGQLAGAETVMVRRDAPEAHDLALHNRYPGGFAIVIDATGVPAVIERLPRYAHPGAKLVMYGVAPEEARIAISPYDIFRRELTLLGSFSQLGTFPRAVKLVNSGVLQLKELVTHTFPLEGWADALARISRGSDEVKMVMRP